MSHWRVPLPPLALGLMRVELRLLLWVVVQASVEWPQTCSWSQACLTEDHSSPWALTMGPTAFLMALILVLMALRSSTGSMKIHGDLRGLADVELKWTRTLVMSARAVLIWSRARVEMSAASVPGRGGRAKMQRRGTSFRVQAGIEPSVLRMHLLCQKGQRCHGFLLTRGSTTAW